MLNPDLQERYRKQALFSGIGREGQERLLTRQVTLVGCGALGCVIADLLTRAGVGKIRIADRDFVELSNLQRQSLFTEQDVADHLPKAIAAAERLSKINSSILIESIVTDVDYSNIGALVEGSDLILDGTDNFEIRYLINDVSLESGIPWIFTGCTGSHGQMMPVIPHVTACLRCLMPSPPPPERQRPVIQLASLAPRSVSSRRFRLRLHFEFWFPPIPGLPESHRCCP